MERNNINVGTDLRFRTNYNQDVLRIKHKGLATNEAGRN